MEGINHLLTDPANIEMILNTIHDPIAIIELKNGLYTYTYMNESMRKGYKDLTAQPLNKVHNETEAATLIQAMREAELPASLEENTKFLPTVHSSPFVIHPLAKGTTYLLTFKKNEGMHNYESLVEMSPDSIFVHDDSNCLVYVNETAVQLLGAKDKHELLGRNVEWFIQNEEISKIKDRINKVFHDTYFLTTPIEREVRKMDGTIIEVELLGSKVLFEGRPAIQTICRNITQRRIQQNRLEEMAYYDQLTNASNRRYFFEQLEIELEKQEEASTLLSLLFLDLDNFKDINDHYGHHIGDEVLVIFSKRVQNLLKECDTFSRLGGDEFVVMLTDLQAADIPVQVAKRMTEKITEPIVVNGHTLSISVSIGISIYPFHGTKKETLLTKADQALYEAKRNGRQCVAVYRD